MKMILLLTALLPLTATAQYRPLETSDEARQRYGAERYETYKERGSQAPLGGYSERLGDPAPRGTSSPGYTPSPTYRTEDSGQRPQDRVRGDGYIQPVVPPRRQ